MSVSGLVFSVAVLVLLVLGLFGAYYRHERLWIMVYSFVIALQAFLTFDALFRWAAS